MKTIGKVLCRGSQLSHFFQIFRAVEKMDGGGVVCRRGPKRCSSQRKQGRGLGLATWAIPHTGVGEGEGGGEVGNEMVEVGRGGWRSVLRCWALWVGEAPGVEVQRKGLVLKGGWILDWHRKAPGLPQPVRVLLIWK